MRLFVGLDVSLAKTAACVLDEHGRIVKEVEVASEPEAIVRFAGELEGTIAAIGLEAGPLSQWLHRGCPRRIDVVLMETRQVKGALKAMPIKTDRRDAEGIARLLHLAGSGLFIAIGVGPGGAGLAWGRKAIQQGMIALELSLRGLLRNFGLKVGAISRAASSSSCGSSPAAMPCSRRPTEPMLAGTGKACARNWPGSSARSALAKEDPVCCRLMTMPGVGAVVALTFRSAIDDPTRFSSSRRSGPGSADPLTHPVGRARRERRDHPAGDATSDEPSARRPRHDEPRSRLLAEKLGGAGGKRRGRSGDGRPGPAHRLHLHRMWRDDRMFQLDRSSGAARA
jgi:transposase